ncbi:DUF86 domain-containing protein [Acerihabitans sp. TG2]|uniref:HepT-like ribonuclease domain-containing protein n=1 Tax=Acerihabitans sp. TG2 TaxID=3096008 RepID=UPI002B22A6D4|nr:DUF86 domain-containing protein [Acerihabitans sp. TG2]MEA9392161.1 DUF86 domain-containing protein [Acerihabitans sp. TG2]
MSKTELKVLIDNILSSAQKCQLYMDGLEQIDFFCDDKTQDSVLMNLIVIGEQASKIIAFYPEFVEANNDIPWQPIKGLRNRVAHGYFDVDLGTIWNTVKDDLPLLREKLCNPNYPSPGEDPTP